MAVLYITEYINIITDDKLNSVAAPHEPNNGEQHVAIGGASAQSAAFAAATNFVMVHTDAICSLAFGPDPTAVTTAHRMAANETRFVGVIPGQKVAVIANT